MPPLSLSRCLLVATVLWLLPTGAFAQALAGQLTILEKGGARSADLADAVIWLESTGGAQAPSRQASQIGMQGKQFVPRVQVVSSGGSVAFPNDDPFRHNVFSKSGPAEFDLGLYARGETRQMQFSRSGVYPIFCNIHARMVAYVVTITSPYVVRPGADGRYAFTNVPPGAYTLKAWHERGGELTRPITIPVDGGAAVPIELDARSYRFVQHKNKFGGSYTMTGSERY